MGSEPLRHPRAARAVTALTALRAPGLLGLSGLLGVGGVIDLGVSQSGIPRAVRDGRAVIQP